MKAIVSLSGGMDSATVLAAAIDKHCAEVMAVGFRYGSKHNVYEREAAEKVARFFRVPYIQIDLSPVFRLLRSDLLLDGGQIPEGHYEAESMKRTVVPGRNTVFASVLLAHAQSAGAGEIWLGVHAGDHAIYPDCRPEWVLAMREVCKVASEGAVTVIAPFLDRDKTGILQYGLARTPAVPYGMTRTCYKGQATACGKCGSCQERLAAFAALGVADPVPYESRDLLPR